MPPTIVHPFAVTIPAGTPRATPLVTSTVFPPNVVDSIEWTFPGGCNGVVGIQIGARTVPIIPSATGQFLVRSGSSASIDLEGMPVNGDWSVIGFNTGSFAHTIQVVFKVRRYIPPQAIPGYLLADVVDLMRGGG